MRERMTRAFSRASLLDVSTCETDLAG
jgi:hypothetical protein